MKKRNKYILLFVLLLLFVASALLLNNRSTTLSRHDRDFAVEDTSTITKFFLADKNGRQVLLTRITDGTWTVNETYLANKPAVDLMLKTFSNLAVLQPVPKAAHNNVVSRMASLATKVEIYQTAYRINLFQRIKLFPYEKQTKVYYVGDNTKDNVGTYMLMEDSQTPFVTFLPGFMGFVSLRYTTRVADWRDHTIFNFRISDMKNVKVEMPKNPDSSYVFVNAGDGNIEFYRLHDMARIEPYDTTNVLEFLSGFGDIKFETIVSEMDSSRRDSIISSVPDYRISVTTTEDREFSINAYRRKAPEGAHDLYGNPLIWDLDRLYVYLEYSDDLSTCQYFVFDRILRPMNYFFYGVGAQMRKPQGLLKTL